MTSEEKLQLGRRVKARRHALGLSQTDLAQKIGYVDKSSISKIEKGTVDIPNEKLGAFADALSTTVSFLRGDIADPDRRTAYTDIVDSVFSSQDREIDLEKLQRRAEELRRENESALRKKAPLSVADAKKLSEELGVTLDYLAGLTADPQIQVLDLPDESLRDAISDADAELIGVVHEICGMDRYKIAEDALSGDLNEIWNPKKIALVREYIEDSKAVLQKMIVSMLKHSASKDGDGQ